MSACFELSRASDGQFRFVLKAANGEIILSSEMYRAKGGAESGIASVRINCTQDARYVLKEAANGKFYFNLMAANNQVIGTSQMYDTSQSRDEGVASVKASGVTKLLKDTTKGF